MGRVASIERGLERAEESSAYEGTRWYAIIAFLSNNRVAPIQHALPNH